jgi:N-acetylmuramoyl-L-alanine amidase
MPVSVPHPGCNTHAPTRRRKLRFFRRVICAFAVLAELTFVSRAHRAFAQATPPARFVVVLDAAHGGTDLGGRLGESANQSQFEKAYALAMSVRLRSLLGARGISVVTTRESDADVDADRRAEIANRANAQACLTIHASQTGTGIHIYASSLAPVAPTIMLPWKTAQAAWVTRSLALAGVVNSAMSHAGLDVALGRTDLPTIDCMACPALAIEIGKQVSQDKAATGGFDDPNYQAGIAQALAAAILEWKTNGWRSSAQGAEAARP